MTTDDTDTAHKITEDILSGGIQIISLTEIMHEIAKR